MAQDALSRPSTRVYAAEDLTVRSAEGSSVAVRWGTAGTVVEAVADGKVVVQFEKDRHDVDGTRRFALSGDQLMLEPVPFSPGQWVQFTRTVKFRSKRLIQQGQPAVVKDMRAEGGPCSVLVRVAPLGKADAFDVSVSDCEIEPLIGVPSGFYSSVDELPGGFQAADVVFAKADIAIKVEDGSSTVAVGRGDVGMVFGPALQAEGRRLGELLIRFEARQDTGYPVYLNVKHANLSREAMPCPGRKAKLTSPLRFPDGRTLDAGRVGIIVNVVGDGGSKSVLQVSDKGSAVSFEPAPGTISVMQEVELSLQENKQARLCELEALANMNDNSGTQSRTVSMLEQNLWAISGLGTGINLSYLRYLSKWPRILSLSCESKCLTLRPTAHSGLDGTLGDETTMRFDHEALVNDKSRVEPYAAAIRKLARGKRVLDIGTGPVCFLARLCLRAGAECADAIENSMSSVETAIEQLEAESTEKPVQGTVQTFLPPWASLKVSKMSRGQNPVLAATLQNDDGCPQQLQLFKGLSTDPSLPLPGKYSLLVHEILGDMAGNEDAAMVVADIHRRGLLAEDCAFVPRSSSTMLAPTSALEMSTLETLLHRLGHHGAPQVEPLIRYTAARFPRAALLAAPQPLECLDFAAGPALLQHRSLEFRTESAGEFDGVHMHLHVDLDGTEYIDVLEAHNAPDVECSWKTLYVRLLDAPVTLPAGSRILCNCTANLQEPPAHYSISVAIGEPGEEKQLASFDWSGG